MTIDAFMSKVAEIVLRARSFVHWPKVFMLPAAEGMRVDDIDHVLSGFDLGSHMGALHALGEAPEQPSRRFARLYCWRLRSQDR